MLRALMASKARQTSTRYHRPHRPLVLRALNSSGVAARAIAHSGEDAVTQANAEVLKQFTRADGSILVPNRFRYLVAKV